MTPFAIVALGLILLRYCFELWLDALNAAHVREHANEVPEAFRDVMDEGTYKKSIQYTLAKAKFGTASDSYSTAVLCALLFSGWLASLFGRHELDRRNALGTGARLVDRDSADVAIEPTVFVVVAVPA